MRNVVTLFRDLYKIGISLFFPLLPSTPHLVLLFLSLSSDYEIAGIVEKRASSSIRAAYSGDVLLVRCSKCRGERMGESNVVVLI